MICGLRPYQPAAIRPEQRETPEGKACNLGVTLQMPGAAKAEKWKFLGRCDEEPDEAMARMRTAPAYNAAEVIHAFNGTAKS